VFTFTGVWLSYSLCKFEQRRVPAEQKVTGILYVHRISDNRMTEPPFTNQEVFEEFCGDELGKKICVTTTHWDLVDEQTGEKREVDIKRDYCVNGTTMARFKGTQESAWHAVDTLLQAAEASITRASGSASAGTNDAGAGGANTGG
jgi:hypothetical protein